MDECVFQKNIVVLQCLRKMQRRKRTHCALVVEFHDRREIHTHYGPNGCPGILPARHQCPWSPTHSAPNGMQRLMTVAASSHA